MNDNPNPPSGDPQAEIALLIRRLHETEERLHVLTGGQVGKVVHPSGASYLLHGAQVALLKSEAEQKKFSDLQLAILDALPAHIALLDEQGIVVAVNDAWKGFGSNNVFSGEGYGIGHDYIQICDQAHGECAHEAHQVGAGIRQVLQGKLRSFSLEYPCHSPTSRQWFRVMVTPLDQGGSVGAVVMHVNVSERKLAEEALRESHERFQQLADSITDVFWIRSADLSVVHYVSPAFSRIWGRPVATLYANPGQWMDFILPEDRDRVRDAFAKLQGDAPSLDIEYRIVRPAGEIRWVRVRGFKVRDAAGEIIRYAGIVTDITEGKQAQARLQRLNRLHTVLSKTSEAVVRARNRQELFDQVCQIVVTDGRLRMALIFEVDKAAGQVKPVAVYGEGQEHLQDLTITTDGGPLSQGTVGTALRTGRPDVCNDFARDPRMAPWQASAARHGFLATASFPLKLGGVTRGVFTLHASEAGYFEEDEVRLMTSVADELSYALEALQSESRRQQAERALQASEQQFANAFEFASIGIALVSTTGQFIKVNRALCQIVGYTETELLGRNFQELTHPDDLARDVSGMQQLIEGTISSYQMEKRYYHKQGHVVWINLSVSLVRDEQGRPFHFISQIQDVTGRKLAALENQRISELLKAVADGTPDAVFVKDLQGRYLLFNEAAARFVGRSVAEVLGHDDTAIFGAEDARVVMESDRRVLESNQVAITEEVLTAAGATRTYLATKAPYRDSAGNVIGLIGISRDITERKQAEELLKKSELEQRELAKQLEAERSRLVSAQRVAKVGSWETDLSTLSVIWSEETHRIFETDPATFSPTHDAFLHFVHPQDRKSVDEAFKSSWAYRSARIIQHRLLLPSGQVKFLEERWQIFRDENEQPVRAIGTCQDITERKQAEVEIERQASFARYNPNIVLELSATGTINYANEATLNLARSLNYRQLAGMLPPGTPEIIRECLTSTKPRLRLETELAGRVISWSFFPIVHNQVVHCYAGDITERRQAEQRAAEFQQFNQKLIEASPLAIVTFRATGEVVSANEASVRMLGAPDLKTVLAQNFRQIGFWQRTGLLAAADAALTSATPQELEAKGQNTFGKELWLHCRLKPFTFAGEPYLLCFFDDIKERKLMEEGLSNSEARFRSFMAHSPAAGWIVDGEGCFRYLSPGYYRMFGVMGDLVGKRIQDIYEPALADVYLANNRRVIEGRQAVEAVEPGRRANGSPGEFLAVKFPIIVPGAEPLLGGLALDITERKLAEERLAEQAALLDITHEAIMVKDLEDRIIFWNKGAESTYGWTAREALGSRSAELLKLDARHAAEARAVLLAKGEWNGELQKSTKDGRQLTVEARWTLVRDEQGQPRSILSINTDITEKKKLEAQFFRAQRLESIGTLASGIAHDLNNVLAPILMSVEMLKSMVNDGHGQMVLSTLETSAQRGADLVKQVLTFARGIQGQRMEVNLGHLLRDVRQVIRETFPKNIEAVFKFAPDQWSVVADPTQLHQVFMNLFVNARDAMPGGGKLEVTTENVVFDEVYADMNPTVKPGSYVLIEVGDTGTGIPKDIRDRIFEPFFTTKEVGKGTGLGLSTVVSIVRSHGGFINVYSEVGRGTLFKLYLPAKMTAASQPSISEQVALPRGNGEWVLVVDDEDSILKVSRKMLERYGYQVMTAVHGADAVAIYAQHREKISVVLTDMAMPVMDGPATIIALKAMNPHIKIIGSSGHASNDGVAKALGAGVKHFIPKPYTADKLLAILAQVVTEPA